MYYLFSLTLFFAHVISATKGSPPSSCAEVLLQGNTKSGIYNIYPRPWYKPIPFEVYCDMETDGGGWTVFQKRDDYEIHENFYRVWEEYKYGFGRLEQEFWLGNEHLFVLTNQDHVTLRVDLEDFVGNKRKAEYTQFQISNEKDGYRLSVGGYHGDAGDGLNYQNNRPFQTYDREENKCSTRHKGAWWYNVCHHSNLNALYLRGNFSSDADGVTWTPWRGVYYSLKRTEMKVRPTNFLLQA